MSKITQKLELTRKTYYKGAKISAFGERVPDYSTMGRKIGNTYAKQREVVCVEACRTPYGKSLGALVEFDAAELGALAIKEVIRRTEGKVAPGDVDYVIMGHVVQAGCGQVPSRQATLLAGLPEYVPSITVNKVCSSGVKTIDLGAQMIALGRAEIVIAGGQESMSNIPFALPDMRRGKRMGFLNADCEDLMVKDGLWDSIYNRHMAIHGSEVADEFGFSREELDEWALHSQLAAAEAIAAGKLDDEIFPIAIHKGKDIFEQDEGPRGNSTMEGLAKLGPVFNHTSAVTGKPGSVTAGNAPGTNDGGDVCLLMSRAKAEELGLKPLFTIVDYAEVSQPTKDIATVPGLSIKKVLEQNQMTLDEVKLIEINEAFAAVALVSARSILGMTKDEMLEKVNVNGGAIAYGHPIGATGARIVMTLAYELKRRGGGYGICGICAGHAQGDAMLIRVDAD
ncbi:thiolase family protein [Desulfosporosinus meridiei]|uniref:acetyl-CoA C-acetyltransferase n=1 Tax=Desulfosporosinus meridiei (strain ATCC BAA-275 / DSM 13257 / KCTC 12902 / NCIMB 13706 / S10) TaxID=768704 RepID=J7J2A0_DESMD|nr:thiolase family protein [Desulfosporosinus meridiei]AFQ45106.1 acetyl-CoA acetyltransferase [Desulfosporosinus meridiei DSM 13257]